MTAQFWKVTRWARALRFWLLLAVALAGWFGLGMADAHAQTQLPNPCATSAAGCTVEVAYQACKAEEAMWPPSREAEGAEYGYLLRPCAEFGAGAWQMARCSRPGSGDGACRTGSTFNYNFYYTSGCPGGAEWSDSTKMCHRCASRSPQITGFTPPNGTLRCEAGNEVPPEYCVVSYAYNGDGTSSRQVVPGDASCKPADFANDCSSRPGMYWNGHIGVGGACVPIDPPECEEGETLGPDNLCQPPTCPSGMILNAMGICANDNKECPAGEVRSPDGSCVSNNECPAGEVRGLDGTCKPDKDEDQQPDEPGDESSFSGGDSCNAPPSCSGDAILCGQARIQWRIECNLRRDYTLSGGTCDTVPVCSGRGCNAMEYAQLMQQWNIACQLSEANGGVPGEGNGWDANGNGIPDVLEGPVEDQPIDQGEVGTVGEDAWNQVNTGGWLGGGACPGLPNVLGPELGQEACKQGGYIQWLMRLLALVFAGAIIGRAAAGS